MMQATTLPAPPRVGRVRDIIPFPHPSLSLICPETEADDDARALLDDLAATMKCFGGAGLAAPQIGVRKRAIVVQHKDFTYQALNPRIVDRGLKVPGLEGCLSAPRGALHANDKNQVRKVYRSANVVVEFLDREGKTQRIVARDFLARCFQHEIDHMDGKTVFDRDPGVSTARLLLVMRERRIAEAKADAAVTAAVVSQREPAPVRHA